MYMRWACRSISSSRVNNRYNLRACLNHKALSSLTPALVKTVSTTPARSQIGIDSRISVRTMATTTEPQDLAPKKPRVAIIIGSNRQPRLCKQVATFVKETFDAHASELDMDATLLDIADWPLPFLDEPGIPSQIKRTEDYAHEHTRRWSREVLQFQAFVFVLPQYNWGYPAVIKNAIDYLFNEWNGKASLLVTYGGHGGNKCAAAFSQVLGGIRMRACETQPQFTINKEDMQNTMNGKPIGITGPDSKWKDYQDVVLKGFKELEGLLKEQPVSRS